MIIQRLSAQPDRSIREAKRLLNIWQLYERLLNATEPAPSPAASITRATTLVLVAEIITRWPALQRALHRRINDQSGLQILAASAASDKDWHQSVDLLQISPVDHDPALSNLRRLLQEYDGHAIAGLANRLT